MGIWRPIRQLSFIAASIMLCACGGNSDNSGDDNAPPPSSNVPRCSSVSPLQTTDVGPIRFSTEPQYVAGQSSAIIAGLAGRDTQGLQFRWQQLEGPTIELVSQNSPVLAFDIPAPGSYRFSLRVTGSNTDVSGEISITADSNADTLLNIRQDHQVVESNDVSLRLGQQPGVNASNLNWCIAQGPDVTIDLSDPFRPLFSAPRVNNDTLLRLRASASINGNPITDDAYVLATAAPAISANSYFETPLARTHAYRPNSPYAAVLADCVYSNQLTNACSIKQLPLIGQEPTADLDSILDRLLVSHDWMGDNFANFLRQMDPSSDFAR
ncbi:MAG: hypothetical protein ACRDBI_04975, partial [Shewanella sp.]